MKRKITDVILLTVLECIVITMLTGCKGTGMEDGSDSFDGSSSIEALPRENIAETERNENITVNGEAKENEIKTGDADSERSEAKDSDWLTLEKNLRPSILQITCGGYTGSGVVWEITEEEVTVVSSGHLLRNGENCEVVCYAGIFYEAEVDRVLEDCDIGFAVMPTEALKEDNVELTAVSPCRRNKEEMIQGEELAIYGSMDYVAGNFVKGYLIEAEREMQLEGYENAEGLLLGGILQEEGRVNDDVDTSDGKETGNGSGGKTDGKEGDEAGGGASYSEKGLVDAGMSGSGVFDRKGRLLGILAGGDGGQGFAAVPVWKFAGF